MAIKKDVLKEAMKPIVDNPKPCNYCGGKEYAVDYDSFRISGGGSSIGLDSLLCMPVVILQCVVCTSLYFFNGAELTIRHNKKETNK